MKSITVWLSRMSLAKLDGWYEKADLATKWDVERACASGATKLARYSAYISRRINGGKHEDAVRAQNRAARRVRQALGYTYADDAVNF